MIDYSMKNKQLIRIYKQHNCPISKSKHETGDTTTPVKICSRLRRTTNVKGVMSYDR